VQIIGPFIQILSHFWNEQVNARTVCWFNTWIPMPNPLRISGISVTSTPGTSFYHFCSINHQTDESFWSFNISLWHWNLKMSEFQSPCNWYSTAIGSFVFKGRGLQIGQFIFVYIWAFIFSVFFLCLTCACLPCQPVCVICLPVVFFNSLSVWIVFVCLVRLNFV